MGNSKYKHQLACGGSEGLQSFILMHFTVIDVDVKPSGFEPEVREVKVHLIYQVVN